MDELLRSPEYPSAAGDGCRQAGTQVRPSRFCAAVHHTAVLLRRQGVRVFHRLLSARADRPLLDPAPFLALAAVVGVASVVSTVYTPGYSVLVDGQPVGTVRNTAVFTRVVNRVEARAEEILGEPFTLDAQVDYCPALLRKDEVSSVAGFETQLFEGIDAISRNYVLRVGDTFIGAAPDRAALDGMLDALKAPYRTEHTVSSSFVEDVTIVREYTRSDVLQDLDAMAAALTANTTGETTYEVKKGDTFSAIANANDMYSSELEALNPDVNIDRLSIGQLLNVKQVIPFLSVRTTEQVTYTEEIPCPVEEVSDASMYQGERRTIDAGIPGSARIEADVTFLNGYEEERIIRSTTTITEPTTKVVAVGTKVRPSWYPNGYFLWPASGRISSRFGYRTIFGSTSFHGGLDIASSYGTSIRASDGGTVTFAGWKGTYGKLIIVNHGNGFQSYYGHCSSLLVSAGDKVHQGQNIAKMGATGRATGNHLHFEIRSGGTQVNPLAYLP